MVKKIIINNIINDVLKLIKIIIIKKNGLIYHYCIIYYNYMSIYNIKNYL